MYIAKLTEFTQDQLQLILSVVSWDMSQNTQELDQIHRYGLANVQRDRVRSLKKRIDDARVITVQVMNAIGDVAVATTIQSN